MAIEMQLELEGERPDWASCKRAAELTGTTQLLQIDDRFGGQFSRSKMFFGAARRDMGPHTIYAEADHGCNFPVHYTIIFRINNSKYDECVQDIKDFLTRLSRLSPMQFVLSHEHGPVYATHDDLRGFSFFWNNPIPPNAG
jgi:hypothetical protein